MKSLMWGVPPKNVQFKIRGDPPPPLNIIQGGCIMKSLIWGVPPKIRDLPQEGVANLVEFGVG